MWELDYKESWVLKNWWFRTVVLEKILKSSLDTEEIQPINPKGNQSWIFIGRTDAEAETPILWLPEARVGHNWETELNWTDAKNWLIWKDSDAGKDWRQEKKGMTEDEMVGWHHQLNEHESEHVRWWRGKPDVLVYGVTTSWTRLSNWTELTTPFTPVLLVSHLWEGNIAFHHWIWCCCNFLKICVIVFHKFWCFIF